MTYHRLCAPTGNYVWAEPPGPGVIEEDLHYWAETGRTRVPNDEFPELVEYEYMEIICGDVPDADQEYGGPYCENGDLYQAYTDGFGGFYSVLILANAPQCRVSYSSSAGAGSPSSASSSSASKSSGSSSSGSSSSAGQSSKSRSSGSDSLSSQSSKSSSSSQSSGSSSSSSKHAIVKAAETWVGWSCVEADNSYFEVVRRVSIPRRRWTLMKQWDCGEGRLSLPVELVASCEAGSLLVIECLPEKWACMCTAEVSADAHGQWFVHALAAVPRGGRRPPAMLVRVRGVRVGHNAVWQRCAEDQARSNDLFYATATKISTTPLPPPHEAD